MARRSVASALQSARSQSDVSEVEVDDSQRVAALNSILRTPKTNQKDLQVFDAKVAGGRQELETLLAQRTHHAEEAMMRRRNELTRAVLTALQTPNRLVQGAPRTLDNTNIARNAMFSSVAHVLAASEHLVVEYERLNSVIADMRDAEPEGIAETWAEDVRKTARLLRGGAKSAVKNVKKVLGADVEPIDVETGKDDDEEMSAVKNMELNYELKESLYYAERGVKKMVQNLPQGE